MHQTIKHVKFHAQPNMPYLTVALESNKFIFSLLLFNLINIYLKFKDVFVAIQTHVLLSQ